VVSSESARNDLMRYPKPESTPITILRFHLMPGNDLFELDPIAVQAKFGLPDKFFIICNQFWAHKNHIQVVNALGELNKQGIRCIVACTGNINDTRNPDYSAAVRRAIEES
jgi:hypothetical protein